MTVLNVHVKLPDSAVSSGLGVDFAVGEVLETVASVGVLGDVTTVDLRVAASK